MAEQDEEVRCADGCKRPARGERPDGMVGDSFVVELVCGRPWSCWVLAWVHRVDAAWEWP